MVVYIFTKEPYLTLIHIKPLNPRDPRLDDDLFNVAYTGDEHCETNGLECLVACSKEVEEGMGNER